MKQILVLILLISFLFYSKETIAQSANTESIYSFKRGDLNGIGKWYMGREIAYVMGFQGIDWLERSEREKEENVSTLINNMKIKPEDTIADIGAGSGYHVFRMAPVALNGLVYAVDIQVEMLKAIQKTKKLKKVANVETVLGNEKSIN